MRRCLICLCAFGALIATAPSSAAERSRMLRGGSEFDAVEDGAGAPAPARPAPETLGLRTGMWAAGTSDDEEDGNDEAVRSARRGAGLLRGTQASGRTTPEEAGAAGRSDPTGANGKAAREAPPRCAGNPSACGKDERTDTWGIFGFTEGSDVGDKGDRTLFQDAVGRFSRRDRGYAALRGTAGIAYTATETLNVSLAVQTEFEQNRRGLGRSGGLRGGVSDFGASDEEVLGLRSSIAFGLSGAAKYRILERGPSPVGVAVQLAPYWQRSSDSKGIATDQRGAEFRILADVALVPERLFAGVNLAYTPEAARTAIGLSERTSDLEASAAVSGRIARDVFLGAELRRLSRYDGYLPERAAGWALFAGPTLYVSLSDSAYVGAAWSVQLAGRSADAPGRGLDLENFERHQLRLKSGMAF